MHPRSIALGRCNGVPFASPNALFDRSNLSQRTQQVKRELKACALGANRLALDLGVPSGRITDVLK